jgi:hypothetical protein
VLEEDWDVVEIGVLIALLDQIGLDGSFHFIV